MHATSWVLALYLAVMPQFAPFPGPGRAPYSAPAGGTWTKVQSVQKNNCGDVTNCTITYSATGAGHLLVIALTWYGNTNSPPTFSSASGGGTWVHCPSCYVVRAYSGNNQILVDGAYVLSSTAGVTSTTYTMSGKGTSTLWTLEFMEYAWSGSTIAYDTSNNASLTACTSCAAPALTLTGTADVIVQFIEPEQGVTAISGSYTDPADFDTGCAGACGAVAGAMNVSSYSAPNWTCTSGQAAVGAMAFKGS